MRNAMQVATPRANVQTIAPYYFVGVTTICCCCSKVKLSEDEWLAIDKSVLFDPDVRFSHGLCPTCHRSNYPDYF